MVTVAATAAVTGGLVLGGAVQAMAAAVQAYVVFDVAADGPCGGLLQSAQVTAGGPADVSVYIENERSGKTCTGWLERSVNKGKTWAVVSPRIAVPSSAAVITWAKSADYADGQGRTARACVRSGSGPAVCSGAMGLRASAARDTGTAVPVSYVRREVDSNGSVFCAGRLSSTARKTATSVVHAYVGDFSSTSPCTGVLESSANGGKTWHVVSATLAAAASHKPAAIQTAAYGPGYADGKGHLARVCITAASKHFCTGAW